jgi:hypothetical protein
MTLMEIDFSKVVTTGTWLYDGTVVCRVVILEEETWPGSGDREDAPDAEDKAVRCVSVWYESPGGEFHAGGGYYHTVEEAKRAVEKTLSGPVEWKT